MNGQLTHIGRPYTEQFRRHVWNEAGQLTAVFGNEYCGYYAYDANGNRAYKLTGSVVVDQYNGGYIYASAYFDDATMYVNPYMVVTRRGYTKHYYNGSQRIASRLGDYWGDGNTMVRNDDLIALLDTTKSLWNDITYVWEPSHQDMQDDEQFIDVGGNSLPIHRYGPYIGEIGSHLYDADIFSYVFLGDFHITDDTGGDGVFFYHSDHLGSANWITNSQGQAVQYLHYMPFGELWENQQSSTYDERFKFSGKERDSETGYDYFGARHYLSLLGIWLSPDPLLDEYPEISSYAYCRWNPLKYVDPNGKDAYIFGEDGSFIRSEQESGQHYGVMLKGDKVDYTFDFADPINDPQAIDNGKINGVIIPTDEQISDILDNSGVYSPENQELKNRYSYAYRESNSGKVYGDGKMDYVITGKYNGSEIINYENYLFLTDVNGKKVAHNNYNFGNFLWGAGISALGIPYFAAKVGSNLNNFLNDPYSKWHFDSKDDQLSIKLGFQWQRRSK